ncbi:MAG TPA: hypothetical protein DEB09_00300 [Candidatus Magasanikbacteria bacterium]|nr:hypothetical protein [Candidatus Magasanikbacteria bacterium]
MTMKRCLSEQFNILMDELASIGMAGLFCLIIGMAKSKSQLARFHNELKPNQRLVRGDYIMLEDWWEASYEKARGELTEVAREKLQEVILLSYRNEHSAANLSHYYERKINEERWSREHPKTPLATSSVNLVLSCPERDGHGYHHFRAFMFNVEFEVSCTFLDSTLLVHMCIKRNKLTENLVHRILTSKLVNASFGHTGVYVNSGDELTFRFDLGADIGRRLKEMISAFDKSEGAHRRADVVAMDTFAHEVGRNLIDVCDLELDGLYAVVLFVADDPRCLQSTVFEDGAPHARHRVWCHRTNA